MLIKKHGQQQLVAYLIWIRPILVWHHLSHPMTHKRYLEEDTKPLTRSKR